MLILDLCNILPSTKQTFYPPAIEIQNDTHQAKFGAEIHSGSQPKDPVIDVLKYNLRSNNKKTEQVFL